MITDKKACKRFLCGLHDLTGMQLKILYGNTFQI